MTYDEQDAVSQDWIDSLKESDVPDIGEALVAEIRRQHNSREADQPGTQLRPSALRNVLPGEGCPRQVWAKAHGHPTKTPSDGQLFRFANAHRMHDWLEDVLFRAPPHPWQGLDFEMELELDFRGRAVYGTADLVLRAPDDRFCVIDIKTRRGNAFKYMKGHRPGDALQVQFYMEALNWTMRNRSYLSSPTTRVSRPVEVADICGGILVVDREGENGAKWFPVVRDKDAVWMALTKLRQTIERDDPPPPIPYRVERRRNKGPDSLWLKKPWQMSYCSLERCQCAEAWPEPPEGKVGTVADDGTLKLTRQAEPFRGMITHGLEESE